MKVYWIQRTFENGEEFFDVYSASEDEPEGVCVATEDTTDAAWRTAGVMARVKTGDALYRTLPDWVELESDQHLVRTCYAEKG